MFGITPFGWVHTAVSIAGLAAGIAALAASGRISRHSVRGKLFVWLTVGSCVSGLCIYRTGHFNEAHALSILTLLTLAAAAWLERAAAAAWMTYAHTALYSLALFFHFIPGFTETFTRVPDGAPLAAGPQDALVVGAIGIAFLGYLALVAFQFAMLRSGYRKTAAAAAKS